MTEKEVMEYIEKSNQIGIVLGLDNIQTLLKRLGNPQEELKFVHIAGTNGKGSVLAYISTVLRRAGYRVGRYISPTIFSYRERIQINEKNISKASLCSYMEIIKHTIEQMMADGLSHPTSFEIETALAFLYFRDKKCDIVVLETGMGGCLDATNVVANTLVAVFTPISRDHMNYLGDTLSKIAKNKAGIIKNKCYVISGIQEIEVLHILKKQSRDLGCTFYAVEGDLAIQKSYSLEKQAFHYKELRNIVITTIGKHQIDNAVVAIEVLRTLGTLGYTITEKDLRKGLSETQWLGRFSIVQKKPMFLVDGAHNVQAAKKLGESIALYFANKRIIYIMGVLKDKEYEQMIQATYSYAEHIITVTTPENSRAMQAYDLAREVEKYHSSVTCADSLEEAVEMGCLLANQDGIIIAFGSLSYLGDLIKIVEHKFCTKGGRKSHDGSKKN